MTKVCQRCKQDKPLDQFAIQRGMKDGRRANCRPCSGAVYKEYCYSNPEKVRDGYYRKMYGISLEQYRRMMLDQGEVCAICGCPETATNKSMAVDHDPVTGSVRRLLCHKCNAGLGHFNDNPDLLLRASQYLRDHEPSHRNERDNVT